MSSPDAQAEWIRSRIERFNRSEMARLLGMDCTEARPGYARVIMESDGKRGPGGLVHGGAIFSLADHAFGLAANIGEHRQVALSAYITYIAPGTGRLEATARCVSDNEAYSIYQVRITDGDRLIALFEGVGIQVPLQPPQLI